MSPLPILLLHAADQALDHLLREVEAILQHWPDEFCPALRSANITLAMENPALLKGVGVVWLYAPFDDEGDLYEWADHLQQQQLPAMLTRESDTHPLGALVQDGIVACPPTTDPKTCCAMLCSLYSQVTTLASMRTELKLLHLHQAGIAGQIDKIDEELRLAAQLQREFLPTQLPQLDPFTFDVLWRPAGYVSGDIYDVERLDEDHISMFIADAVGHGVPAALMTVYIKRSLAAKELAPNTPAGYRIVPPSEALQRLNNDMVAQQSDKMRFATGAYIIINCRTLVAQVARAGHPFPMLLRDDGSTEMLEPEGGLLGIFPDETYEQIDIQLQPNDRLLLYSDGFEMAFPDVDHNQKKRIANDNYAQQFQKLREGSLSTGLTALGQLIDTQAGSLNQRDDLTLLGATVSANATIDATSSPETTHATA